MWKDLTFSMKVIMLVSVLMLFAILTGIGSHLMSNQVRNIGIESASDEMLNSYKTELTDVVDLMSTTLIAATEGMTDKDEVYNTYSDLLKDVRFFPDKSGYFFVYEGTTNFVLPTNTSLEGKDLSNLKDANGLFVIQELDKAAKAGGDFVEYLWDKPGAGNQLKLSYAQMIPNTPYFIGTGVYIDDIEAKEAAILTKINEFSTKFLQQWAIVLLGAFFLIVLPVVIFMIKSMTSPLVKLTEIASDYSLGEWDTDIGDVTRKDEVGELTRAIKRLGVSTRMFMKKLEESKAN